MTRLEQWTRAVIRWRFLVLGFWVVAAGAGVLCAIQLPSLLATSLAVPGSESQRAGDILSSHFAQNPDGTFVVVMPVRGSGVKTGALNRRLKRAARLVPRSRVTPIRMLNGVEYGTIVSNLDLQPAEQLTPSLRRSLRQGNGNRVYLTGVPAIQYDLNPVLAADLARGERFALPAAGLVLALVLGLRTLLIVPLAFAGATISAALGVVWVIAHFYVMASYAPNLVELVGLGLAIDYSLLFVHRFREESGPIGSRVDAVVVRTMETAGRTVMFSGIAVAVGLSAVLIMPVPFIRSLGVAGVVVPLVALLAALTIQPALLSLVPDRGILPWPRRESPPSVSAGWFRLGEAVTRRPAVSFVTCLVLLLLLALPILRLPLSPGSIASIPSSTESGRGLALLRTRVGAGTITPVDIVADSGAPGHARKASMSAAQLRLGERLLQDPQAFVVQIGSKPPWVDTTDRYLRMQVIPRRTFSDEATQDLVRRVRSRFIPAIRLPPHASMLVGGAPAQGVDFVDRVYSVFPWIAVTVLVLAYLVLLRAFRSVILPLVAVLLDVVSVAATYGLLVLVFRYGLGSHLQIPVQTQIEAWIPVFLFAALFGLSMDYQVFLVTRMREAWDRGTEARASVVEGVGRTGRIVTAAAAIMVVSFSGFIAGSISGLQEFGLGLAAGVLLDATLVRIVLLPSAMTLLGPWCWWLPASAARLIRVEATSRTEPERRGLHSRG